MSIDLIKVAATSFTSAAAAVAIAGAIFATWMPREFDTLRDGQLQINSKIDDLAVSVSAVQTMASNIELTSSGIANTAKANEKSIAYLTSLVDPDKRLVKSVLGRHMSDQSVQRLHQSGELEFVKGAVVNGNQYLFIDSDDIQKLNSATLSMVRTLSENSDVTFQPWFVGQYPGDDIEHLSEYRLQLVQVLKSLNPSLSIEGFDEVDLD
ncbi:hypothetical protein [Roseobacter sp. OBYS 0001]|uniref:hypothetical protein n=1 Tax=Roseobacter sp. OBYS 0001 TaxID=882651 RepID=UPI001BC47DA5|nr:hypothetical protein [Roseobacter sp. OBYS 0001]GIT87627.1 hypothetical protein ROBYS_26430 [Roseobacter sp. OBYS 0001]